MKITAGSATELRSLRKEVREARDQIRRMDAERGVQRGQLTKAQQEIAEWKRRFDLLLTRIPMEPPL